MKDIENSKMLDSGFPINDNDKNDDMVFTGTAALLSKKLGVSPVIVRLAFIVLSLFAGYGLIAYLILFLFSPKNSAEDGNLIDAGNLIGAGMLIFSSYFILYNLNLTRYIFFLSIDEFFPPIFIAVVGLVLIVKKNSFKRSVKIENDFFIRKSKGGVFGVCAAVGAYFGIKIQIVRVGFVLLTFSTFGLFALVYPLIYFMGVKE